MIRLSGKIAYDESRISFVTAWVPGRIDKLFYNYTGVKVNKGTPMVYIYSPELLTAQEEYLQALKINEALKNSENSESLEMAAKTIKSAVKKLELYGLTTGQIKKIMEEGKIEDHITINSPVSGTVIKKNGFEGMYLKTGTNVYTIADLSSVWAWLDVYESDVTWLQEGQEIEFSGDAFPGEIFKGKISFIEPFLNEESRTVRVRVNIPNKKGRLKPGMFLKADLKISIPKENEVQALKYVEKWICPMECEDPKDEPGTCSVCGMKLVKKKVPDKWSKVVHAKLPLVIPASAPLITGKKAVVYVEVSNTDKPTYEGRIIELGPKAGDYYIVKSGLKVGEKVVVEGNFKIDSEMQIRAKPSMMSMEMEKTSTEPQNAHIGHQH